MEKSPETAGPIPLVDDPIPEGDSEEALMRRAVAGDRAAYARIFESNVDRIRRAAYFILHDQMMADDVAQETFTKGLAALSSYRGESKPQAWFYTIAINICRHLLRSPKRGTEPTEPQKLEGGERPCRPRTRGAFTMATRREAHRLLKIALGYLTEAQREVFVLHYQDDLPYEEIGQILGIRAGAARALAHRAKAVLREKLGSHADFGGDAARGPGRDEVTRGDASTVPGVR